MYYGNPAIDRTASSCSASNFRQPRPQPQPRVSGRVVVAPGVADEVLLRQRVEPAYVVLESDRTDVQSNKKHGHGAGCHATPRPGRRRIDGNAIRILLLVVATAFLALTVSPVSGTTSKKEEKMAMAASIAVTEETIAILKSKSNRIKIAMESGMDLLAALQLYNTTRQGVSQVPGWGRVPLAYYFQGDERELRLNEASYEHAVKLIRQVPEFTISASVRQEENNSGTIVAFSHGNNRYLELQSSGRKNELRFHYISRRDGTVHVETFPFRLADNVWHKVALSVSGSQVELLVDCHSLYRRLLKSGPPDTNFTLPQLGLWVGQRNVRHFLFKGSMQDVLLVPGSHGFLAQCPELDTSCPTCGQFYTLENMMKQLEETLSDLRFKLALTEERISKLEECECQKSCRVNGTVHEDGATWEKGCQQCSCVHGKIECRPTPCAPVNCKNPVIPQGKCCPACLKQCLLHGVLYDHGEKASPKQCVECDCNNGVFTCKRFDTETRCPPLPCPPSEQISVAEECCKFCPGVDYCAKGHKCHANASCLNLQTTYACHCDIGFQGDGHNCHDIDECKQQGGSEGHHCNANTKCVNVVGSYTCECLPGYHRVDKFNCAELDECATGHHACDEHATCVNTAGSYYCICKEGYVGDGYTCKPVCNETCQNGGECVAPGKCSCRRGYIGNSCELDLDECASDLHRCHQSSTCFNMPGWYYCRCKPGYRSAMHDSIQGTQCLDIDECTDDTIEMKHTCHPSAKCVNTEGGYQCVCPLQEDNRTIDGCRLSCWYENREMSNGEIIAPPENPCRKCICKEGVVTCRDPVCDCSAPGSHRDKCCPQCDPAASCRHQELHHLVFRSGERWIYQCQTCECLYGEIDCWQMECPPVSCANPVTEDGDCCPRCEDDPCARESLGNGTSLSVLSRPRPCSYSGVIYDSGSSWQDAHDKCTTCECKDGQLCCSYDYGCAGDLGSDEQQQRHPVVVPEPVVRGLPISSGSQMANGAPEAALSPVTVTNPAAATPITTSYVLSASSSSSFVNSRRNIINGKGHWSLQNALPKLPQQQQLDHHHHYHHQQQQQRDDRRGRMQTQYQQPLSTARYQLASGSSTTPSSAFERSPSSSSSATATATAAATTSTANIVVKQDTNPQTNFASRRERGKVASNNDLANFRSSVFSGFASSVSSSSRSTSTPFTMLGSGSKPAADSASTSSSVVSESASARSYRESASTVSTASGEENQGSNAGKPVASRIDTGAT